MPLSPFHPIVQSWFANQIGQATDAQKQAWPAIAAGKHVLVVAPTGSGKTLAAFLWAIDSLLTGRFPCGTCRVLYVSPLRALNNDIQRNLLTPLASLRAAFSLAGLETPNVSVMTRSGDTPSHERQRMTRHPPEILITTPESLNNLLTSRRGRISLSGLRTVILDEVHAVIGTKRGVHLITAVDRLVPLCGNFQRIALSATIEPPERVAAWIGGYERLSDGTNEIDGVYRPRDVVVARSVAAKRYSVIVSFPAGRANQATNDDCANVWPLVTQEVVRALERNRSTLVFANSKQMVEKLTRFVNDAGVQRVYAHHGALSRETRALVEQRLKEGATRGIVATNSLELGIDIGQLDEVLLIQTPSSVASAVQRIGRAGHGVGDVSRAAFLPLMARDVLNAAVIARAVRDGTIEPVRPVCGALDVLAQVVVSMTSTETFTPDGLHAFLRTSSPYHELSRRQLDLVLDMLAGRLHETRIRELRPMISYDRVAGTIRARPGAELLVYLSGGTIPDRGYFRLRNAETMALIGELDEEFVWERSIGDTFTLGVQSWKIERITHNDVLVRPAKAGAATAPFWRGDARDRSFELSCRIADFVEGAEARLDDPEFGRELRTDYGLDDDSVVALLGLLKQQKRAMAGKLPHRHRVVVENVAASSAQGARGMVFVHAFWGGAVNRPLMMALQAAWERDCGVGFGVSAPGANCDDACIVFESTEPVRADELFSMVACETVEDLLCLRLGRTGFFGARFREAAGRALLLPKHGFRHRNPLWLSRVKGKNLLAAVAHLENFPITVEAWRECLQDAFDLPALHKVLQEVRNGKIELCTVATTAPSPFASGADWRQVNQLMYEDDTPKYGGHGIKKDYFKEILHSTQLRPRLPQELAAALERKLQRTEIGWSPRTSVDLLDWVVERVFISADGWDSLRLAVSRDHEVDVDALVEELGSKILKAQVGSGPAFVTAAESIPRWRFAVSGKPITFTTLSGKHVEPPKIARRAMSKTEGETSPANLLANLLEDILRFFGPVCIDEVVEPLGLCSNDVREAVDALAEVQKLVVDRITEGALHEQVCDSENLERLLRMMRVKSHPVFETLPVSRIPSFLAQWQRLRACERGLDGLREALDRLVGLPLAAVLWETEVLPARVDCYNTTWLDSLFSEMSIAWLGCTGRKIMFVPGQDRELFAVDGYAGPKDREVLDRLFPHREGRFTLDQMLAHTMDSAHSLTHTLWGLAWKGRVATDGFHVVRRGVETDFGEGANSLATSLAVPVLSGKSGVRRGRIGRSGGGLGGGGWWYRVPDVEAASNALEQDEVDRDRVRVLLDRWGVLFRELLEREAGALRWGKVFRALRVMELSGEVVSGQFFYGIDGLQFASPAAVELLRRPIDPQRVVWFCATDPASICGLVGMEGLPRRVSGNHMAYKGEIAAVVSEGRGKRLVINLSPDDPDLPGCLGFLSNMVGRQVKPIRCVTIETINGQAASRSVYRPVLEGMFDCVRDGGAVKIMRRY